MKALSLDPGRTSGWCRVALQDSTLELDLGQEEWDENGLWTFLENEFQGIQVHKYLIVEDFHHRQQIRADLYPVRLIGVCMLFCSRRDIKCVLQSPSQGKGFFTDEQLKKRGLYFPGAPHARDAERHMLQWLTFEEGWKYTQNARFWGLPGTGEKTEIAPNS